MALIFPSEMAGAAAAGRPFVYFREKEGGNEIFLPIPAGVSFADGGNYSTINMGIIGAFLDDKGGGVMDKLDRAAGKLGNMIKEAGKDVKSSQIAKIAMVAGAGKLLEGDGKEKFMASTKKIINPNTNTTFEGNTIRQFSFEFTMVGRSEADSNTIREIHNTFRKYMYPESTPDVANVILDYPPIWDVQFHNGQGGGINEWIPKMYECYLTSMSAQFNPSALMFRTDYSPAEISLSLQFQETRTLMRDDIEELKAQ